MALKKALVALCLGSAAAFNPRAKATAKAVTKQVAAGVLAAAAALPVAPALAADSLVLGTPLEEKLAAFGAASYPVVNSITDAGALADKFIEFIDAKVKPADASAVVNKAVDGLLAIPDGKVSEYAGVLKQVVYKGVSPSSCVTLGGSEAFAQKLQNSAAVKSVPSNKIDDLQTDLEVKEAGFNNSFKENEENHKEEVEILITKVEDAKAEVTELHGQMSNPTFVLPWTNGHQDKWSPDNCLTAAN